MVRLSTRRNRGTIRMIRSAIIFGILRVNLRCMIIRYIWLYLDFHYNYEIHQKPIQLFKNVLSHILHNDNRYTYSPVSGAVYGTLTQAYQFNVLLGNMKIGTGSKVTLVGYNGEVQWKTNANNTIEITMPPLPLDSGLKWAWVFKFENVLPNTSK